MNKTWLVLRNEVLVNVNRRSWLLATIGVPLVLALVLFARPLLTGSAVPQGGTSAGSGGQGELQVEGYVDHGGLIQTIPANIGANLVAYADEDSARQAFDAGEITAYYVVPEDYVSRGEFVYVYPDLSGFSPKGQSWVMRWTLLVNLLDGDVDRAQQVWNPMDLKVTAAAAEPQREVGEGPAYWIPYATGMVLYTVIIMSSSLLRQSMGSERKDKVQEVLMLSVSPRQVLTGKLFGLAVVGLLQTLIWAGAGYAMMRLGGQTLNLPADVQLPISIVLWSLVFFVLGYIVYASLLGGVGALAGPNRMGSSSADVVVIWPLIIPIFFMMALIQNPNGSLAVALSLFPLTAPVAMVTRLAVGGVPLWQPLLAAALMAVTAVLIMRAVATVFRAQMLLSGQPFSVKRYFTALLGRAQG
ncbi:MAG: ABC transporter permease [Anaerolineales bacterium]|nr:MAG: ABC transporter permease [Anaerolineales bacterium]